jgi:hypothetical protein
MAGIAGSLAGQLNLGLDIDKTLSRSNHWRGEVSSSLLNGRPLSSCGESRSSNNSPDPGILVASSRHACNSFTERSSSQGAVVVAVVLVILLVCGIREASSRSNCSIR